MTGVLDRYQRPLGSLRISVTDRCNLRCRYCMPEDEYTWLPRSSLLSFEEITRAAAAFASLGAGKIRLTGGEPLLRQGLTDLVAMLRVVPGVAEIALTTNGLLLAPLARQLREAGLDRITMSLDTLQPERMAAFARSSHHADAIAGLDAAREAGFERLKINAVLVRGFNDDEIVPLVRFARARGVEMRFIEYMDVGGATRWSSADVVSREEILTTLAAECAGVTPMPRIDDPRAPAERFRLGDGTIVGIIASTTAPFCRDCDRARLTADGTFFRCLYGETGIDLRGPIREGISDGGLGELVAAAWRDRADRGAEDRTHVADRGILVQLAGLKADPRKEMHVRGG
ncbi:MAG: GTP 3',8-cyclase MoaA [Gemmatimonadales bacterium]